MNITSLAPPSTPLDDLIRRLARHSPQLEDLSPSELENLGRLVLINNLVDDLRSRVALSRIDCVTEMRNFLATASPTGSWQTARAYSRSLEQLDRWAFHQGLELLNLGPRQADDYIYSLRLAGRSPGSIRLDIAGPSAFFTYLERRYDVVSNPFRGTKARPPYRASRLLAVPSAPEVDVIVASAGPELRAALLCMSQRGLRVGALPSLVFHGPYFSGISKGKIIEGRVPPSVIEAMREARLRSTRPFHQQTARYLGDRVRRHIERLASRGEVQAVYSAHDLRHFYAVTHYQAHQDIYRLKELLGHSDLRNTERYLRSLKVL